MIKLRNISKSFGKQILYEDLDIDLPENKITFIVGRSGSGKSTLLNIISGMDSDYEGKITINDQEHSKWLTNNHMDYIFQSFNLLSNIKAIDTIKIANQVINRDITNDDIQELSSKISISNDQLNNTINNLSGGEQQRIAILRSISRDSKIILADEPTGNLDQKNSDFVFELFASLKQGRTVVIVSHDLAAAQKYADLIIDLENNVITENQPKFNNNDCQDLTIKTQKTSNFITKLKPTLKLVFSDFKKKWFQFILIILTFLVGIQLVSNSFIFASGAKLIQTKNDKLANNDLYIASKENGIGFSNQLIYQLKQDEKIKFIQPKYQLKNELILSYKDINISLKNNEIKQISNNDFYKDRIQLSDEGFSLKTNEIILSKEVANKLNITQNNVMLDLFVEGTNNKYPLKVTNISTNSSINGISYTYLNADLIKMIDVESYKSSKSFSLTKVNKNHVGLIYSIDAFNIVKYDSQPIIQGKKPTNSNEIVISNSLYERNKNRIQFNKDYLLTGLINNKIVKIVGITNDETPTFYQTNINTTPLPIGLELYSNDNLLTTLNNNDQYFNIYKFSNSVISRILASNSKSIQILVYASVGIILLFLLIITVISKLIIDSKKKDIGILKVLKAKVGWALFYHLATFILLSFITLLLTLMVSNGVQNIVLQNLGLTQYLSIDESFTLLISCVVWLIFSLLGIIIYSIISINTFLKNPLWLLNK
ncbi:ABC transporter ATP-binding protein [Mycoplasma sp. NEAQ87857]|uniref:ABC transporter ATP-binding protein n=1 Tax=Mycoplasma sp. NEAQ87857 TaxID=2683967 RepID=UPI00131BC527|nr:ABC transporter ATP-binding protein [Mycoplasma sp. NEAQ87857]